MHRSTRFAWLLGFFATTTAGCQFGNTKCDADMKKQMPDTSSTASSQGTTSMPSPSGKFLEKQYQGTSYFVQKGSSEDVNKALHSGAVRVQNGCMFVGDAVVIWHHKTHLLVPDLLAEFNAGTPPQLSLGGGGSSLEEDKDRFPMELQERCGATAVWYSDGELNRPFSGCVGKTCGAPCSPCRPDDADCLNKVPEEAYHCNIRLQCDDFLSNEEDCEEDDPTKNPCAGLDAATCGATKGCQIIEGQRLDESNQCQVPLAVAGCTSGDCGDAEIALAKDLRGEVWVFSSYCYPDDWTEIESVTAPAGWDKWPACGG